MSRPALPSVTGNVSTHASDECIRGGRSLLPQGTDADRVREDESSAAGPLSGLVWTMRGGRLRVAARGRHTGANAPLCAMLATMAEEYGYSKEEMPVWMLALYLQWRSGSDALITDSPRYRKSGCLPLRLCSAFPRRFFFPLRIPTISSHPQPHTSQPACEAQHNFVAPSSIGRRSQQDTSLIRASPELVAPSLASYLAGLPPPVSTAHNDPSTPTQSPQALRAPSHIRARPFTTRRQGHRQSHNPATEEPETPRWSCAHIGEGEAGSGRQGRSYRRG